MAGTGCILVCVTRQVSCERLIRQGAEMAHVAGAALNILHVAPNGTALLGNPSEGEALDNAAPGATVQVRTAGGQVVSGIVKNAGLVEIQL